MLFIVRPMDYIDLFIDRKQGKENRIYYSRNGKSSKRDVWSYCLSGASDAFKERYCRFLPVRIGRIAKQWERKRKMSVDKMKDKFMTRDKLKGHDIKILKNLE